MWTARLQWKERDLGDDGSQDQEGLPQFLLRSMLSEEGTGPLPLVPCTLRDSPEVTAHLPAGVERFSRTVTGSTP